MSFLFDTNIVIGLFNNDEKIVQQVSLLETLNVSVITIGELMYGAYLSKNKNRNIAIIDEFISCCSIFEINHRTTKEYAVLKSKLKILGKPIPENDIWIAAVARENNLKIVTRDKHLLEIGFINTVLW